MVRIIRRYRSSQLGNTHTHTHTHTLWVKVGYKVLLVFRFRLVFRVLVEQVCVSRRCISTLLNEQDGANQRQSRAGHAKQGSVI